MPAKALVISGVIPASAPPTRQAVDVAVANEAVAGAYRMRAGRAGRHDPVALAAQAERHGEHTAGRVGHQQRDGQRRQPARAALAQRDVLVLGGCDATEPGADDAADPLAGAWQPGVPAGRAGRLARRDERELREAVGTSLLLAGEQSRGLETDARRAPIDDADDARAPVLQQLVGPEAERTDGADAGDRDAFGHVAASAAEAGADEVDRVADRRQRVEVLERELDAVLLVDDLGKLDEVERVDVDLVPARVRPAPLGVHAEVQQCLADSALQRLAGDERLGHAWSPRIGGSRAPAGAACGGSRLAPREQFT